MNGASLRHGLLTQLLNARLMAAFLPRGCRVHTHDSRLQTPGPAMYHPDIYVTCRPIGHLLYDTDAEWVVEIASPSTATTDVREKSTAYRQLPRIRGHLIADPDVCSERGPRIGWEFLVLPVAGLRESAHAGRKV